MDTAVGYSGGHTDNPTYQDVCKDETAHAEVVQGVFDPAKVSYEQLLNVFWQSHDPTQVNRQVRISALSTAPRFSFIPPSRKRLRRGLARLWKPAANSGGPL